MQRGKKIIKNFNLPLLGRSEYLVQKTYDGHDRIGKGRERAAGEWKNEKEEKRKLKIFSRIKLFNTRKQTHEMNSW